MRPTMSMYGTKQDLIKALYKMLDELERENRLLTEAVEDVCALVDESGGVYGLHLNGDQTPWGELLEGGRFEEWLLSFSKARAELEKLPDLGT